MNVDVLTEVVIDCPVARVASFAMDPDNAPKWYQNIESAEWRTPKPLRKGSRIAFVAHFLGKRLTYTYELVDVVPDRRLQMRTSEGPFPMETTYEFEPIGTTKCRMRLRNRGTPSGFAGLVAPIIGFAMRSANRTDLARLKQLLEQ
jgi:uncharacterized membrane protein